MSRVKYILSVIVLIVAIMEYPVQAAPQFDMMGGFDFLGVCINNCAQCKKLYGAYFDGQLCADACIKFRGKIIPDCDDIESISPFLTKIETH